MGDWVGRGVWVTPAAAVEVMAGVWMGDAGAWFELPQPAASHRNSSNPAKSNVLKCMVSIIKASGHSDDKLRPFTAPESHGR